MKGVNTKLDGYKDDSWTEDTEDWRESKEIQKSIFHELIYFGSFIKHSE